MAEEEIERPPEPPPSAASSPLGVIADAIMQTFAMTVIAYLLYVLGTFVGLCVSSGGWGTFGLGADLWILLVPAYVLIATLAGYVSVLFALLFVIVLWIAAVYSETLKSRLYLLATIFAIAFASAWRVASDA